MAAGKLAGGCEKKCGSKRLL